ncbi:hypothetical protein E2562_002765 [Oryza meyeriana var. granulata]|uniref:PGG domain-containing protein n=1 Tax=Oryza meyeriana var. granulata TaxID=110450 RepID=A0A6G1BRA4_9ORYZ|nr:hypothetical protein E2562_002765 [Oryza meyeriana var. granulata]
MHSMASQDPNVLLGRTAAGNTCLHISCAQGHEEFCESVVALNQSLLAAVNADDETPLITATKSGHASLASLLLMFCQRRQLSETVLQKDKKGCNALHHAIRSGHRKLALELIAAERGLSRELNNYNESPMFIAAVRNFTDVIEKLLEISDAAHGGSGDQNALHAAVRKGNPDIAKRIMQARPLLAREEIGDKPVTPICRAVIDGKIDVLTVLLEHDQSLGYVMSRDGFALLTAAGVYGHVAVARELLKHCPDTPYCNKSDWTCLHAAASNDRIEFVQFVLGSQQLGHLVNFQDKNGQTALHVAARKCNSRIISALLLHQGIDVTLLNNSGQTASAVLAAATKDTENTIWIPDSKATAGSPGAAAMDRRLLQAATSGDTSSMLQLALHDPGLLLGTTPEGNTCLHISSVHGHEEFCKHILKLNQSLLDAVNVDGETPLLVAVTSGQVSLASFFLRYCRDLHMSETIMKQDKHGCNALHHAIRSGHRELALELIQGESALTKAVNKYEESPMFIAVMRNFTDVFEKLLEVPDSAHGGAGGYNALHAAIRNNNAVITKKIVQARPKLARERNSSGTAPIHFGVLENKIGVLRVLLEHDFSLGYLLSTGGAPLLVSAAFRGHVDVARELLKHCPDAPILDNDGTGRTCLHAAVEQGHTEFVEFIVQSIELRKLINMRDNDGDTALHYAIRKCYPKIVAILLQHQERDVTMLNNTGTPAVWWEPDNAAEAKTLNWNEVSMLMLKADPEDKGGIYNLNKSIKNQVIEKSRKDIRSLTQTYTSNTSLVAILIATITFAAAFTLPGGYSNDAGSEGLPIMDRKLAFQAFLISDTLAMCTSLTVAFICIIAKWEDLEFLLYYRSFTKKLMWFAYMATTTAFATGLYTVLIPRLPWLAIAICVVSFLLPVLTKLIGEWPILKLRIRLRGTFESELLDMV